MLQLNFDSVAMYLFYQC